MSSFALRRHAFSISAAAVLLASCGGSQLRIGAPSAMPQSGFRSPLTTSGDLLYLGVYHAVNVYSYPSGGLVQTLGGIVPAGICIDAQQNVWIVDSSKAEILEYAHGGTIPIAMLHDKGRSPFACSINPKTGDLAVSNTKNGSRTGPGSVSIYKRASGNPSVYADREMADALFLSYDAAGNLFIDGYGRRAHSQTFLYAELPSGGRHIVNLRLNGIIPDPGDMHASGQGIALEGGRGNVGAVLIFKIVGSKIVGLTKCEDAYPGGPQTFYVVGKNVLVDIVPIIYYYKYPAGGPPLRELNLRIGSLFLAVSRGNRQVKAGRSGVHAASEHVQ